MAPSLSSPPLSEAISEKDVNLALADPGVQESPTATAHAIPGSLQSTLPLPSPVSGTHGSGMNRPDTNSHSSTHILPTSRPTNLMATDPSAFAQSLPHASWTSPFSQSYDDIEVEDLGTYEHGGFHAVVLGETFSSRRYTVVHKLGHGGFATVWLVWDHTNREYVALRILHADQSESCEELEILQYLARLGVNLEENFICPLLDSFSFDGPNGHHPCLVFPLAGQSVDTRLFSSRPETKEERIEMARQYGRQLAHAVAFLHSVGIVHGDLTQRNILTQTSGLQIDSLDELYNRLGEPSRVLADRWGPGCRFKYLVYPADLSGLPSSNKLLLNDFGQAFSIGHPPAWGLGTPTKFATPEGLYLDAASPGSDIWAIGVLLFEWWCGQPLFRGDYRDEVSWYWTAFLGKLPEAIWSQYTDRYKSFDDDGRLLQGEPENLAKLMNEHWEDIPWYGPKKHIGHTALSCSHDPPEMPFSVIEDSDRDEILITLDLPCATGLPDASSNQSESLRRSANGTKAEHSKGAAVSHVKVDTLATKHERKLQSLSHCISTKPPVELSSPIAEFHCLLEQLFSYDPSKRLPAFILLQHHWFSGTVLECDCSRVTNELIPPRSVSSNPTPAMAVNDDLSNMVMSGSETPELGVNSQSISHPTRSPATLFRYNNSNTAMASDNDMPGSVLSGSDTLEPGRKLAPPRRQSLLFDIKSKTWCYVAVGGKR